MSIRHITHLASILSSEQAEFEDKMLSNFIASTGLHPEECETLKVKLLGNDYYFAVREINNHSNNYCAKVWMSFEDNLIKNNFKFIGE
jgi:hypothetical protein